VKKLISIAIALVMVLLITVPVLADVQTGVTVTQGGGAIPAVMAKWETPDDNPVESGTQVKPSLVYGKCVEVCMYAVVFDAEDRGAVQQVTVDVWHPDGEPDNGSMKYNNLSATIMTYSDGLAIFNSWKSANVIKVFDGFVLTGTSPESVEERLIQGDARIWKVCFNMHYCQPAGDYGVGVKAVDKSGNVSTVVAFNRFTYVAMTGFEVDFTSVTYPNVTIGSSVVRPGDTSFGTANAPTIRNLGNVNEWVSVKQSDMGFGRYADGTSGYQGWKVNFDARLGPQANDGDTTNVQYAPDTTTQLPNKLYLCETNKLDFSIHLWFAVPSATPYTGTMCLSVAQAPWDTNQPQVDPGPCLTNG